MRPVTLERRDDRQPMPREVLSRVNFLCTYGRLKEANALCEEWGYKLQRT